MARGSTSQESNFTVFLSSYQIINEEVDMECSWEKCTNLVECNKWRRNNLEKYLKRNQSHIIVAIKVHDEKKNKDTELTFIDIIGFDRSFTDRIMNGETDADFEEGVDNKNEINIHCDLFALRNLLLAIDQARTEGYELNDVSLTEERCIAKVISHKLRMDNKIHLIGFASDDNDCFQQTLNTLEFCLKFKSCLSPEIGRNLNIQHDSDSSCENEESEEGEGEYVQDSSNSERLQSNTSSFSRGSENFLNQNTLKAEAQNSNIKIDTEPIKFSKQKVVSPKHLTEINSKMRDVDIKKSQNESIKESQNILIDDKDIINYLK